MPISGPTVHEQLTDAYAKVQSNLEFERAQITQAKEQREELDDDRSEALVALAKHYLPELTRDAIHETWPEVRAGLSQILLRKEDQARRIQDELDAHTAARRQQDDALLATNVRLDQAIKAQQDVADQVEKVLQGDDQFVQLSDRAAVAEAALERAEANLQEIDQDSARKLPAYESSALFGYLHQRGYGTAEYTRRGFTRRMDRWLAKFIDYNKARQSYEFLRKTPQQMRQIIAADRQSLDTVMDELERKRDEVAAKFGLSDQIQETQQVERQRDDLLTSLDQLLVETEAAQRRHAELEDVRGPYYQEAVKLFREMLDRHDSDDLKRRAQQTVEITDDQIVARLTGVEAAIGQLDDAARRRRHELDQIQSFLEDLGRLVQRFRAAEFDSARSQFVDSLDIFDEVEQAREADDIGSLWKRIRRAQRWGPTVTEKVTRVATHPLTQVLINAMAHAAGGAMQGHARRAGDRRAQRDSSRGDSSWGGNRRRS